MKNLFSGAITALIWGLIAWAIFSLFGPTGIAVIIGAAICCMGDSGKEDKRTDIFFVDVVAIGRAKLNVDGMGMGMGQDRKPLVRIHAILDPPPKLPYQWGNFIGGAWALVGLSNVAYSTSELIETSSPIVMVIRIPRAILCGFTSAGLLRRKGYGPICLIFAYIARLLMLPVDFPQGGFGAPELGVITIFEALNIWYFKRRWKEFK